MMTPAFRKSLYICCKMLDGATGSPNVCNMLCATMLQDVKLQCCVRLSGPLCFILVKRDMQSRSLL